MAQGNQVTLVGNLTDDPELRYTPNGTPVATFTVAINRRTRDESGQWKDGETSFLRCNVWRQRSVEGRRDVLSPPAGASPAIARAPCT